MGLLYVNVCFLVYLQAEAAILYVTAFGNSRSEFSSSYGNGLVEHQENSLFADGEVHRLGLGHLPVLPVLISLITHVCACHYQLA